MNKHSTKDKDFGKEGSQGRNIVDSNRNQSPVDPDLRRDGVDGQADAVERKQSQHDPLNVGTGARGDQSSSVDAGHRSQAVEDAHERARQPK